jgi:hypothetical protein
LQKLLQLRILMQVHMPCRTASLCVPKHPDTSCSCSGQLPSAGVPTTVEDAASASKLAPRRLPREIAHSSHKQVAVSRHGQSGNLLTPACQMNGPLWPSDACAGRLADIANMQNHGKSA